MPRPNPAEYTVAEIDQPDVVDVDAEGGKEKACGPAQPGSEHRPARSAFLHPAAEQRGGEAEDEDRDAEDPAEIGEFPVVGRGLRDADQPRHRQVEHAERVGLADAQVHAERGRRHHPAAKTHSCYGALATEQARRTARQCR